MADVAPEWILAGAAVGAVGAWGASWFQSKSGARQGEADRTFRAKEADKDRDHQLQLAREQRQADWKLRGYVNIMEFASSAMAHVDWKNRDMQVKFDPPIPEPSVAEDDPATRALANLVLSPEANALVLDFTGARTRFYLAVRAIPDATPGQASVDAYRAMDVAFTAVVAIYNDLGRQLREELGTRNTKAAEDLTSHGEVQP